MTNTDGHTSQQLLFEPDEVGEPMPETVHIVVTNYDSDPHPHVEGVYLNEEDADEMMERCHDRFQAPHPIAWEKKEVEIEK